MQSLRTHDDADIEDFDVVIVGGGLTGLTVAYYILKQHVNLSVLILESQDSVGGRLIPLKNSQGFYSHDFQEHFKHLIQELKVDIEYGEKIDDKKRIFSTKKDYSTIVSAEIYNFVKLINTISLNKELNSMQFDENISSLAEISVADILNRIVITSEAQNFCKSLIFLTCYSSDIKNISLLWWLILLKGAGGFFNRLKLALSNDTRFFFIDNINYLIECLEKNIILENGALKTSEPVSEILLNNLDIRISTNKKKYKCSYVVIAVPPSQTENIVIGGSIDTKELEFLDFYEPEEIGYFEAEFRSTFWFPEYSGIIVPSLENRNNLKYVYNARKNFLAGFFSHNNPDNLDRNVLESLSGIFRRNLRNNVVNYHQEIFKEGFMNILKPCSMKNHVNPMKRQNQRIIFAASEFAENWPGTADGAVEAGIHAACLVLHHVRPQIFNSAQISNFMHSRVPKIDSHSDIWQAKTALLIVNVILLWHFYRKAL